jgi:putative nucleotidyltransferase with HDIG domain
MEIIEVINKLSEIEDLPSLPVIASKIVTLVENPKTRASDITKLIQQDPSLTAKVMKIVNSAYYGFPRKISTITHAIMVLGFKDINNLVMGASVFEIFKNAPGKLDKQKLWEHSVGVAVISQFLARRINYAEPEEVFVVGLLHDIGKIILELYWSVEYGEVISLIENNKLWITDAEEKILSLTHAEVGYILLDKWKLPRRICRAIQFHHRVTNVPAEYKDLAYLVHAADVFARIKKIGSGGDNAIPSLHKDVWFFLKLTPDSLKDIYATIDEEKKKIDIFLNMG